MSYGMTERLDDLALLIDRMHEDVKAKRLKRGGKDFLSGLIKAYAILATDDPDDLDAAFAAALTQAAKEIP